MTCCCCYSNLIITEFYFISGDGEIYIDAYGRGQLLSQTDCLSLVPFLTAPQPHIFEAVEPHKVMRTYLVLLYITYNLRL